ncbi:MAG: energy transducer TonB [Acidobacteria bacterium]|nr:energy transducer TonB [Acidobacteriota bacterium]
MTYRISKVFLAALLVALLLSEGARAKNNQQEEAAALLARAAEEANIRSAKNPPFRLRARVRFLGLAKGAVEGTYVLLWVSPHQWREQIVFPGYAQIRIGGENKFWQRRNVDFQPFHVYQLQQLLDISSRLKLQAEEKANRVRTRKRKGAVFRCFKAGEKGKDEREFCFDQDNNTLSRIRYSSFTYEYTDHKNWHVHLFPHSLRAFEGGNLIIEATIEELTADPLSDASFFQPPQGAQEWHWCQNPVPSKLLKSRVPRYPATAIQSRTQGVVSIYALIRTDGKLENLVIVRSGDPQLNGSSLEAVRGWRYRPKMCGGIPVRDEVVIDVRFRLSVF